MNTDKIEPALSAEEWERWRRGEVVQKRLGFLPRRSDTFKSLDLGTDQVYSVDAPQAIALLNDLLPDSDNRKITLKWVKALRSASVVFRVGDHETMQDDEQTAVLRAIADTLEFYLPPEGT